MIAWLLGPVLGAFGTVLLVTFFGSRLLSLRTRLWAAAGVLGFLLLLAALEAALSFGGSGAPAGRAAWAEEGVSAALAPLGELLLAPLRFAARVGGDDFRRVVRYVDWPDPRPPVVFVFWTGVGLSCAAALAVDLVGHRLSARGGAAASRRDFVMPVSVKAASLAALALLAAGYAVASLLLALYARAMFLPEQVQFPRWLLCVLAAVALAGGVGAARANRSGPLRRAFAWPCYGVLAGFLIAAELASALGHLPLQDRIGAIFQGAILAGGVGLGVGAISFAVARGRRS
jgi:hypothetical protein